MPVYKLLKQRVEAWVRKTVAANSSNDLKEMLSVDRNLSRKESTLKVEI